MNEICEAAVLGAGVMGAGIAAQLASAGVAVTLLDLDPALAEAGVARQLKAGGFVDPKDAKLVRAGSVVSDLGLVTNAAWIIEAAAERIDIKHQLFKALNAVRRPGSIVSSNTSTIPLAKLIEGMDEHHARDFLITHFFNPPRWMPLMEMVAGPETRTEAVTLIADFAERRIGKTVIRCRDTPGFVANRIGNFWMAVALDRAVAQRLDVEEADAAIGHPFGAPVGIFALLDLVGIDLLPSGWSSLQAALPEDDALQAFPARPTIIARMIADGRCGRKAGAGFTRRLPDGAFETLDLFTYAYRPAQPARSAAVEAANGDLRALMTHDSPGGRFARAVILRTLAYAASLVPAVADSADIVDRAMRDGYGWKQGPFELIDRLGPDWLAEQLALDKIPVPPMLHKSAIGNSTNG